MYFDYSNRKDLEEICVHDSVFYGFEYNYSEKQIKFNCDYSFERTNHSFVFNNVIFLNVQTCFFWCDGGSNILWLSVEDDSVYMDELYRLKAKNEPCYNSCLDKDISYLQLEFQLNSGDTIFIICESVDVEETPCEESI